MISCFLRLFLLQIGSICDRQYTPKTHDDRKNVCYLADVRVKLLMFAVLTVKTLALIFERVG